MGGVLFHPIYWQTACLLQRSGALDGKTADYNKIAKAVSALVKQGVNIQPIDLNKSERDFSLDAKNNVIYFGFSAVKGLKEKVIDNILIRRPFDSMLDFIVSTGADITSIVTLLKAGGFDKFGSRMDNIKILGKLKAGLREKLNGQNFLMLSREGHWPQDFEELVEAQKVFNFTQYLKSAPNDEIVNTYGAEAAKEYYQLDDRACEFLDKIGYEHDGFALSRKQWKYYYDLMLAPMKQYLVLRQEEMLEKVNHKILEDWTQKYFPDNNIAQWEIETMGLCFADHPLKDVINVAKFDDLPQEPEIATVYKTKTGRHIPLYRLTMICGIVIAKDKLHSSITLLTAEGPVDVKFRKEQFAHYDSQISQQIGGKKSVVEKSWLNRGVGLIIHGMRQDDIFVAKTYKNSPMKHTAYKITKVLPNGKIEVQKDRKKGRSEESNDE